MEQRLDILLVDDDRTDLALFRRAVVATALQIRLTTLNAGQQAIDYLEAKREYSNRSLYPLPDLIVVDLKMPGVNGFDFLAWRKASTLFSPIPVVILSGSNESSDVKRIFELGANKHVLKPTDFEDWGKIIREIWDFGIKGTAFLRAKKIRASGDT